jgi:hypothetical protein
MARPRAVASVPPVTGVEATERRPRAVPPPASPRPAPAALLRRHWAVLVVLAAAAGLRVVAEIAIYPGTWFSDTNNYLQVAATGTVSVVRVSGYALFVAPFWHAGSAAALIIAQHLLGLGIVALIYALLIRRGAPRGLAVLAVIPAALDAYLIAVEHAIMSDTVFHAAVVGAIALLLWSERPALAAVAAAGLLLGYAGLVRSVGAPFAVVFVAYLLLRRVGWRAIVAFCLPWVLVTAGYAALFDAQHGSFGLTTWGGRFLYARVATFADCSRLRDLPADERSLCPDPRHRMTSNSYLWNDASPIHGLPASANPRIRDFALRVIRDKPGTYARSVAGGVAHFFRPGHPLGRNDYQLSVWQFPRDPGRPAFPGYRGPIRPGSAHRRMTIDPSRYVSRMVSRPRTNAAASRLLHNYQRHAYTSGLVLAGCLLVVLVALVRRRVPWRLRLDAALLAAATLSALVVASALSVFSYRYGLIAVVLLPPAAALAGTGLLRASAA